MPSKKILDAICWDKKACMQYTTFPAETPELGLVGHVESVLEQIESFYLHQFNIEDASIHHQKIGPLVFDALTNSQIHGSKKGTPFTHGLFIARKGICNAFKDEGNYFKSPEIKEQYENRLEIKKFDKVKGHHGIGVNLNIFPNSDLIEVDTKKGILYCAQYLDNLL